MVCIHPPAEMPTGDGVKALRVTKIVFDADRFEDDTGVTVHNDPFRYLREGRDGSLFDHPVYYVDEDVIEDAMEDAIEIGLGEAKSSEYTDNMQTFRGVLKHYDALNNYIKLCGEETVYDGKYDADGYARTQPRNFLLIGMLYYYYGNYSGVGTRVDERNKLTNEAMPFELDYILSKVRTQKVRTQNYVLRIFNSARSGAPYRVQVKYDEINGIPVCRLSWLADSSVVDCSDHIVCYVALCMKLSETDFESVMNSDDRRLALEGMSQSETWQKRLYVIDANMDSDHKMESTSSMQMPLQSVGLHDGVCLFVALRGMMMSLHEDILLGGQTLRDMLVFADSEKAFMYPIYGNADVITVSRSPDYVGSAAVLTPGSVSSIEKGTPMSLDSISSNLFDTPIDTPMSPVIQDIAEIKEFDFEMEDDVKRELDFEFEDEFYVKLRF